MNSTKRLYIFLLVACTLFFGCGRQEPVSAGPLQLTEIAKAQAEIDRSPDLALGYTNLAMVYMKESRKTGDFTLNENAAEAVARALAISPADVPARKLAASLDLAHHRFAEAATAANKLAEEFPSDSFAYGVLTDAYTETGDYEKAIESAQRMVDLKPGTASYSRVAQLRSLHGDHDGAIEMFAAATRSSDPTDKETRGWCLVQLGDEYWKHGKYGDAEKAYDEALQVFPDYFLAMVSKGRVRASVGDYGSAEKILIDVQKNIPNANAMLILAEIYSLRGNPAAADQIFAEFDALQEKLGDAADHRTLGLSWADRQNIPPARALAEKEYAAEKSVYSADLLAWALYRSGDSKSAKRYMGEALRLNTKDAMLLFHAGMIAKGNKEFAEAKRLLAAALKLNAGFSIMRAEEARKALAELN
jgi:tetratricopeptide (TPR) repeat protein